MQTIYAFTTGYEGDNVVPFWNIWLPVGTFFRSLTEGTLNYWYANATRFIPYTIHEFPSYSFVVSDVHGHVLSLPFVLLAIALIIRIFGQGFAALRKKDHETEWGILLFYGFLLGVLLMTNAMDGPIYGLLFAICWLIWVIVPRRKIIASQWFDLLSPLGSVAVFTFIVAMPFLWHFNSFATGIGVNCPPPFLANTKIGPFLFESVENCQRSPLWMMWLLWGFFWFSGVWLFIRKIWNKEGQESPFVRILKVFYLFGIALIIFPEFFYAKDIYPQHFRSNTMFKLGYQAFIMWSIVSGYVLVHVLSVWRTKKQRFLRTICIILFVPQVFLVSIFPFFSVRSYFANLSSYVGIYGLGWLEKEYPDNFAVIQWLKEQQSLSNSRREIKTEVPILVEAAGDSYTDYNQISAFTGFPAITGWAVHEWLWRGTYDIVSPRQEDVRKVYESTDPEEVQSILDSYHVSYIVIGTFEREKYKNLQTTTIEQLASPVFTFGDTTVYRVNQ